MRSILFALAVLGCSCAEKPRDPTAGIDLLARHPDECLWQAGELVPDEDHQWGELGQFGWETRAAKQDGVELVWTSREKAYLNLPASQRRDRTIRVTLCAPPASAKGAAQKPLAVEARLNDMLLATLTAPGTPQVLEIHAPSRAWVEGDNLLQLSSKLSTVEGEKRRIGFGVARVSYDRPQAVAVDVVRRSVRLDAGTSVRYRIEPLSAGRVLLRAHASAAGTLQATLVAIDPATGAETPGQPQAVALSASQDVERAYVLPGDRRLCELCIAWLAPDGVAPGSVAQGSELQLTGLALQEFTPVERPPIILISVDTLSARHLSAYGYPLPTSPFLERLAQESCVFDQCLTNAPWTLPSFLSLMTGLYARAHQLNDKEGGELWERWYLAQNRWTLAEFLRAAGYTTAGFVDNAWITERYGFPQGFELYDASAADNNTEKRTNPDGGIRQTAGEARRFLDELAPGSPFFLFVHCFDVHGPYTPPAPFDGSFDGAKLYDPERRVPAGGPANVYGIIPTYVARGEVPEGPIPNPMRTAPFEGAYDESVRFVDDELGKFYDYLKAKGLLDKAWLIVTADHGETMADSNFYFGHGVLEQDVVHVPLFVRPPGGLAGGKRVAATVQLVDVYPTLLELLDPDVKRDYLSGRSFLPFLRSGSREPSVVLSESGFMRQAMLVAGGWKLLELEPSKEIQKQALLSHPVLDAEFFKGAEGFLREKIKHNDDGRDGRTPQEREQRLFGWQKDAGLQHDLELMRKSGLTDELLADMETAHKEGLQSLLTFLKRALDRPYYELFDLATDPNARHNLADERPDKLRELKALLEREKDRREIARANGHPPTQSMELSKEDADELRKLGYGGGEDDPPAPEEHPAPKN